MVGIEWQHTLELERQCHSRVTTTAAHVICYVGDTSRVPSVAGHCTGNTSHSGFLSSSSLDRPYSEIYGAPFSHLFTELKISPIEVHISAIQLEISPIQLKISPNQLEISTNRPI